MVGGYLSLLYSVSDKPLEYWRKQQSHNGRVRKILDADLLDDVIEIYDTQEPVGTSIMCPTNTQELLDIRLSVLVLVIKNVNLTFEFQLQIIDVGKIRHYFQFCNSECQEKPKTVQEPFRNRVQLKLDPGWNQLEIDLERLIRDTCRCKYEATQRLEIRGNCRLRRIYFIDRRYNDWKTYGELSLGFLNFYMSKWGIGLAERSTQTNEAKSVTENAFDSVAKKRKKTNSSSFDYYSPTIERKFLKNLQSTSGKVLEQWFTKHWPESDLSKETPKIFPPSPKNSHTAEKKPKKEKSEIWKSAGKKVSSSAITSFSKKIGSDDKCMDFTSNQTDTPQRWSWRMRNLKKAHLRLRGCSDKRNKTSSKETLFTVPSSMEDATPSSTMEKMYINNVVMRKK